MASKPPSYSDRWMPRPDDADAELLTEEEDAGYRPFAQLRQARATALMIEFRFASGDARAFGYSWLVEAKYNPSVGVELTFTGARVRLRGRNLHALFVGIARHLVYRVREAEPAEALTQPPDAPVVESIKVAESGP